MTEQKEPPPRRPKVVIDPQGIPGMVRILPDGTRIIGSRGVPCSTPTHGDRLAVVLGWFRASFWPKNRIERAAYCEECASKGIQLGYFHPDHVVKRTE
jgi:hypothetical protein